jgi:hypothetical protein
MSKFDALVRTPSCTAYGNPWLSRHLALRAVRECGGGRDGREYLVPGMWLVQLRGAFDPNDAEVLHHHVVAGAELAAVSEHVIEFVPVQRADHGIGVRRARGLPLQRGGVVVEAAEATTSAEVSF